MESGSERRRAPRQEVRAAASLRQEGRTVGSIHILEDLSLTGARLCGRVAASGEVRLLLRRFGQLLELPARVVRVEPRPDGRAGVALAFLPLDEEQRRQLAAIIAGQRPLAAASVLVFDGDPVTRVPLARRLRLLGHGVLEARTALEATFALQRADLAAGVAFVGERLYQTALEEFVPFALHEYPRLRLVTPAAFLGLSSPRVRPLVAPPSCLASLRALLAELLGGPRLAAA